MLTLNLAPTKGLCNGTVGTVIAFTTYMGGLSLINDDNSSGYHYIQEDDDIELLKDNKDIIVIV